MSRALAVLLATCAIGVAWAADDGLFYYVNDSGDVVVTNLDGRADLRPVPGTAPATTATVGAHAALPATPYDEFIERLAREHGLSPSLIKAVALVESGFDPTAVSPKGAQGLMQLMPATAREYGVRDAFDPYENLRAGTIHLRRLLDRFEGDLTLALAAYNAGEGAVRRSGGVPAYRETREYVRKVHDSLGPRERRRPAPPPAAPVRMTRDADGAIVLTN